MIWAGVIPWGMVPRAINQLKFPFFNYATRSITVAISGFRVALP
jgi:hypothetical protein